MGTPEYGYAQDADRVTHVAVLSLFGIFALIAVIIRFWARKIQHTRWQLEDYFCLAGLVLSLSLTLFTIHAYVYWDLGGSETQQGNAGANMYLVIVQLKAILIGQLLWISSVSCLRASIIILYIHIFPVQKFRIACSIVLGVNASYWLATVLAALLICQPVSAQWTFQGKCGDQNSLDLFIGVFNLLIDVSVIVLPMPILWSLKLSTRKKLELSGIFGMGTIFCIVTLFRIIVVTWIKPDRSNAQKMYALLVLFTCLETLLGVINTCLPIMRPAFIRFGTSALWLRLSGQRLGERSGGGGSSSYGIRNGGSSRKGYIRSGSGKPPQSWPVNDGFTPAKRGTMDAVAMDDMFDHHSGVIGLDVGQPGPRVPPKSKDPGMSDASRILVQQVWDTERGVDGDSDRK
ncbi:hypothetical protein MMC21_006025 [Puttea exsequens]|nr:hypothetical protein [Puttea exsequens]